MFKVKRILKTIVNTLLTIFLLFAIVITVLTIAAQSNSVRVPSLGGKTILTVLSPSMEPTIKMGDIIISDKIALEAAGRLETGTVITFGTGDLNGDGIDDLNTHRIVGVEINQSGNIVYVTKGDNNPAEDTQRVSPEDIMSVWNGSRIAGAGKVLSFLQQPTGFLLVIVLPLAAFFVVELIMFIKKYIEVKNEGKKVLTAEEEEELKRKAIEEYLRSQAAAASTETQGDETDKQ